MMIARTLLCRLRRNTKAIAMTEFALALPVFLTMALAGAELTNYITTKMRISQVALHLADHAARMGSGTVLSSKMVSETHINDVLTGAGLQAGNLQLYNNGRVILSSLEPMANPNTNGRYQIKWQRCRGSLARASSYGVAGAKNLRGIGPANRQVTTPDGAATMFVEVVYRYRPIIPNQIIPNPEIREIASMVVRDRRDLTEIYNHEGAPRANC
jgi:hypothetical protein